MTKKTKGAEESRFYCCERCHGKWQIVGRIIEQRGDYGEYKIKRFNGKEWVGEVRKFTPEIVKGLCVKCDEEVAKDEYLKALEGKESREAELLFLLKECLDITINDESILKIEYLKQNNYSGADWVDARIERLESIRKRISELEELPINN